MMTEKGLLHRVNKQHPLQATISQDVKKKFINSKHHNNVQLCVAYGNLEFIY